MIIRLHETLRAQHGENGLETDHEPHDLSFMTLNSAAEMSRNTRGMLYPVVIHKPSRAVHVWRAKGRALLSW